MGSTIGFLLFLIGFIVYYIMPYSFLFGNLPLFLGLLTGILIAMLFGMVLVSQSLQSFLEQKVLHLIVWGSDRRLKPLIVKNMAAHGSRNQKTALMFTIALAFALFASSMSTLQSTSIIDSIRSLTGSDIFIISYAAGVPINYVAIRDFLTTQTKNSTSGVEAFSFVTFPLFYHESVENQFLGTLSKFLYMPITLYGIEQNYLDATYAEFTSAPLYDKHIDGGYDTSDEGTLDFVKSLYTASGTKKDIYRQSFNDHHPPSTDGSNKNNRICEYSIKTMTAISTNVSSAPPSEHIEAKKKNKPPYLTQEEMCDDTFDILFSYSLHDFNSIALNRPVSFTTEIAYSDTFLTYTATPRAMLNKLPGFFLSSYIITAPYSGAFVTMETYNRLLSDINRFSVPVQDLPSRDEESAYGIEYTFRPTSADEAMGRCEVKMRDGASEKQRIDVMNSLRVLIDNDMISLVDTAESTKYASVATQMLLLYFTVVSGVALMMCFFVLWLSFTANMRENSWELGVLRAIGLTFHKVLTAYIYEGCCVIISTILLGSTIGLLVSITLTLQFNLFTEMGFNYAFPTMTFSSVIVMTMIAMFAGTYFPGETFRQKGIANLLKGL